MKLKMKLYLFALKSLQKDMRKLANSNNRISIYRISLYLIDFATILNSVVGIMQTMIDDIEKMKPEINEVLH